MSFDFPSGSLTVGQIVTGPNSVQYRWDGTKWTALSSVGGGPFLPLTGGTLTGPLTVNAVLTAPQRQGTTTNDNAQPGMVGEVISAILSNPASGISLPNLGPATIVTLAIPAGDWELNGEVWIYGVSAGTSLSQAYASINTAIGLPASSALNNNVSRAGNAGTFNVTDTIPYCLPCRSCRVSLAAATTYYLVSQVGFSANSATGLGLLWARRVR